VAVWFRGCWVSFRFVHAADIHLDSPLRSLALRDPSLAELIGNATRQAFVSIVDLCLDEQVESLLLAGDLYDGDQTSMKTALFLAAQLRRLHDSGIAVFIIRGNHDALSRITKELTLPETVKVFGGRAEAVLLPRPPGATPVAVHGISFAQTTAPESLLPRYKPPIPGAVNIGLMHTSLDGSPGHDPYAPCSVASLQGAGFDYWALGHIHARSVVIGRCTIVMPGMPQGRDINEAGPKTVSLVTIGDDHHISIEQRPTAVAQFERVPVDLTGITDWRETVGMIGRALAVARARVGAEHLIARLQLTGATPLAWRLRADHDLLRAEATDLAAAIGRCWVEGLELACTVPGQVIDTADGVPVTELRQLIHADILHSDAYRAELTALAEELRGQLPPDCRHLLGSDEAGFAASIAALAEAGVDDVLARLQAPPSGAAA